MTDHADFCALSPTHNSLDGWLLCVNVRFAHKIAHREGVAMAWKYFGIDFSALHVESRTLFGIRFSGESASDFELIPPIERVGVWSPEEMERQKADLWPEIKRAREQRNLQFRLQALINAKCRGENLFAASTISRISGKDVSARSIQAWLIDPRKEKSSRTCPAWAVEALETYFPDPKTTITEEELKAPLAPWLMRARYSVESADHRIEAKERLRKKWADASLSSFPKMVNKFESSQNDWNASFLEDLSIIKSALRDKKIDNFDDFRRFVLEKLDNYSMREYEIHETMTAIEQRTQEYSNPEGLPDQKGNSI
jgi:hypothetical protein